MEEADWDPQAAKEGGDQIASRVQVGALVA